MIVTNLFKMWTKVQTFKGNAYVDPNSWMELVVNIAFKFEECNAVYKKNKKEMMTVIINRLPKTYDEMGIRRDLFKKIDMAGMTLEILKKIIK